MCKVPNPSPSTHQNGCEIGTVPLYGYGFPDSFNKGTIRIETIRYSFQQLQQPPKIKVKRTINCISIVTQHSQIVCIQIYPFTLISFRSMNIYQGIEGPSIWGKFAVWSHPYGKLFDF